MRVRFAARVIRALFFLVLCGNNILSLPACAQLSDEMRCLDPQHVQGPEISQFLSLGYFNLRLKYHSRLVADEEPIFGKSVPYDRVWLDDSPAAILEINRNIKIGELSIPAGTYSLFFLPSLKGLTLIVSKKVGKTGKTYDVNQEIGRVEMITSRPANCKMLTLDFSSSLDEVSYPHRGARCGPDIEGSLYLVLRFNWREANFYALVQRDSCADLAIPSQPAVRSK